MEREGEGGGSQKLASEEKEWEDNELRLDAGERMVVGGAGWSISEVDVVVVKEEEVEEEDEDEDEDEDEEEEE